MARGNRRWGRILLITALVALVLLVALDRIGVAVAEDQIAKQARTELTSEDITTDGNPSVTVDGFPFLTQVASGHYDKINIVVRDPTSKGVRIDSVHITATGVNAPADAVISGNGQIEADRVVGVAQLDWQSLQQLVDLSGAEQYGIDPSTIKITGGGNGQITLSVPLTIEGQSLTAIATGAISVTNDLLHVRISNVSTPDDSVASEITSQLAALASQLTFDVRVPALPYHLVVDSVTANADGIEVSASATDVVLAS